MSKVKLIALESGRFGYRTRRLLPGDEFEVKASEAKIWVLLKKAKEAPVRPPAPLAKPPTALLRKVHPLDHDADGGKGGSPKIEPSEGLNEAREEYQVKLGKRPWHGWGIEELRRRISEAE